LAEEVRFRHRSRPASPDCAELTGLASPAYTLSAQSKGEVELVTVSLPNNRRSQAVLALALVVTVAGGLLALAGGWLIGLPLFGVGLVATIATSVWCFKNWDF
jgi:hypothetical protein